MLPTEASSSLRRHSPTRLPDVACAVDGGAARRCSSPRWGADSRQATAASPREGMPGPSTGYRPRRHCWGRAEPRRRRVWLRSHARSARVEPSRSRDELQELQLGAWPSSPLESDLAAAACRVGSCGENQREDVQWLDVGALEIRSIVVGSTGLLRMRFRSLLELRLRMRRLCVGPSRMQTKMHVRIRTLLETA